MIESLSSVGEPVLDRERDSDVGEVVWNGISDRAWAASQRRPAPPSRVARRSTPQQAPTMPQSAFLAYLRSHAEACHDSQSIATALDVPIGLASQWLSRAWRRGIVRPHTVVTRGGRPATVFRVVNIWSGG